MKSSPTILTDSKKMATQGLLALSAQNSLYIVPESKHENLVKSPDQARNTGDLLIADSDLSRTNRSIPGEKAKRMSTLVHPKDNQEYPMLRPKPLFNSDASSSDSLSFASQKEQKILAKGSHKE